MKDKYIKNFINKLKIKVNKFEEYKRLKFLFKKKRLRISFIF